MSILATCYWGNQSHAIGSLLDSLNQTDGGDRGGWCCCAQLNGHPKMSSCWNLALIGSKYMYRNVYHFLGSRSKQRFRLWESLCEHTCVWAPNVIQNIDGITFIFNYILRKYHTFIWETLVEYGICYLIMQLLNLSMLSFRLVLITVIQCYTNFQRAVFWDYREFITRLPVF